MKFTHKHITGIKNMNAEELTFILDTAISFKEINRRDIKKVPTLRGKTIINLFLKPVPGPVHRLKLPASVCLPTPLTSALPVLLSSRGNP